MNPIRKAWLNAKIEVQARAQPLLCRFGQHDSWDIAEYDGSVRRSACLTCFTDHPPHHPREANAKRAAQMAEWRRAAEEHVQELEL